jgi:hypothetical protein
VHADRQTPPYVASDSADFEVNRADAMMYNLGLVGSRITITLYQEVPIE